MADFFSGEKRIGHFVFETGKQTLSYDIVEKWIPVVHDTAKCGATLECKITRRVGLKKSEKELFENSIGGSLGVKGLAKLKTNLKDQISTEFSFELAVEEARTVTFPSPQYGRYIALQYQKIRNYDFQYEDKSFFHRARWQVSIGEYTNYFHDDSKRFELDPACNPPPSPKNDLEDYDGFGHFDMGNISMFISYKKSEEGIIVAFNQKEILVETVDNRPLTIEVSEELIPESLRWLAQEKRPFYKGILTLFPKYDFSQVQVAKYIPQPPESKLIPPHGGKGLVCCLLQGDELEQEKNKAEGMKKIQVNARAKGDLIMIGIGAFSPLCGFMTKADWKSVCENFTLADGTFWPVPITLDVSKSDAENICVGDEIALEYEGDIYATMNVTEKYEMSEAEKKWECEKVFMGQGEDSVGGKFWEVALEDHPGVQMVMNQKEVNIAGPIKVLSQGDYPEKFKGVYLTPSETRAFFEERGWKEIAALQLRNPMHRSHEFLAKIAVEVCDGVLIHSLIGKLKPGDIPADVRIKAIDTLVEKYFVNDNVMQAGYSLDMRYAGPREALLHATFRQNYGVSRMIIGRDHAGVGDFYGLFEAQDIFDRIPTPADRGKALLCKPLKIDWTFYCHKCDGMASMRTCPHTKEDRVIQSGTKLRRALREGGKIPDHFTRPEVEAILRQYYENLLDQKKEKDLVAIFQVT